MKLTNLKTVFRRWENKLRGTYCLAYITKDLLDRWVMVEVSGKVGRRSGSLVSIPCLSKEEAMRAFLLAQRKRLQRGYRVV